jgi:hypothetical protein
MTMVVAYGSVANAAPAATDHAPAQPSFRQDVPADAQALADKYAPIVYLRNQEEPCDKKGEAYAPSPVEIVLGNPNVTLRQEIDDGIVDVATAPSAADLYASDDTYFLDFPGSPRRPKCGYEQAFREMESDPGFRPVAYAHIAREPGKDGLALQYWFYFYFNDWNNNHESDWEMVQLVFDASSPAAALEQAPRAVAYAQHGGGETASWDSDKLEREGDRVAVYTATGSHASQYSQKNYLGRGEQGTGFGCDDASSPSRRLDLKARVIPEAVDETSEYAWIAYEGRWGEKVHGELNGPTGPNTKKQWSEPISWMDGLRDSSVVVPEETIGPNAVIWFCNVVSAGSQVLFAVGPWAVLGLIVAGIASIGITVSRTDFRPVLPAPLRRTRRFGQIITSSFAIYRSRPTLFLGIGAIFVPLGVLAAGVQALLDSLTPVGPIADLVEGTALDGALALAAGMIQFGIAYWLVISAVVASLAITDRGQRVGVTNAYELTFSRFRPLVGARLRAIGIIALLSVTLIGIPLAVYLGVRWTFLEQAVLFDGTNARDARRVSARVVSGHWWRTLGVGYSVAAVGIGLGPIIGMLFVLLSSIALTYINVLTSIFYVALIPFVAIAFTLLYFDLQVRNESRTEG